MPKNKIKNFINHEKYKSLENLNYTTKKSYNYFNEKDQELLEKQFLNNNKLDSKILKKLYLNFYLKFVILILL